MSEAIGVLATGRGAAKAAPTRPIPLDIMDSRLGVEHGLEGQFSYLDVFEEVQDTLLFSW